MDVKGMSVAAQGCLWGWKKFHDSPGMGGGTTEQGAGGKLRHGGYTQGQVGGPVRLFGEQCPGGAGTALPRRAAELMEAEIMLKIRQWLCCR